MKNKTSSGVTIMELMMSMTIMAVIIAAITPYILTINRVWSHGDAQTEMLQHGRVAIDRITKNLRNAVEVIAIDTAGNGDYIEFINNDSEVIAFYHNLSANAGTGYYDADIDEGDIVMRTPDSDGDDEPENSILARSAHTLDFAYLTEDIDVLVNLAGATPQADVAAVRIELQIENPLEDTGVTVGTMPMSSFAYLRMASRGDAGGCWVADQGSGAIVKLSPWGIERKKITGFNGPLSVSVDPSDGSCWVANTLGNQIVKLNSDGTNAFSPIGSFGGTLFSQPFSVSVNSYNGSCWVGDGWNSRIVRFTRDGAEDGQWAVGHHESGVVSASPLDNSCWATVFDNHEARRILPDGSQQITGGFVLPASISVDPNDNNSCWLTDIGGGTNCVIKLDSSGGEIVKIGDGFFEPQFLRPRCVSTYPTDGTCWIANTMAGEIVRLGYDESTGTITEMARRGGFSGPMAVCVDPADGSCWVTDTGKGEVVKLDPEGIELFRTGGFDNPWAISVIPE